MKPEIIVHRDGSQTVDRVIGEASNGGIMVRLLKIGSLRRGAVVRVTQSADGKKFRGEIVEAKE